MEAPTFFREGGSRTVSVLLGGGTLEDFLERWWKLSLSL